MLPSRRNGGAALALAALVTFGACSSGSSSDPTPASAQGDAATASGGISRPGPGGAEASGGGGADLSTPGAPGFPGGGGSSTTGPGGTGASGDGVAAAGNDARPGPPPMDFPYKTPLKVKATLEPQCVERGGKVDLAVETGKPEAAIVYNAVYADGFGGSGAPFGKGYGGNDKGYTAKDGTYESFWVVSLDAPEGPARVDVIVGFDGKWGYDGPHFAVADAHGDCPRRWLESEEKDPN